MNDFGEMALGETELALHSAKMLELLDPRRARAATAYALAMQLCRFVGAWRRMVVIRDRDLYRPLLDQPHALRGSIAIACRARLDGLGAAFECCAQRWPSSAIIDDDRRRFATEMMALLALTRAHFECERSLLLSRDPAETRAAA